MKLPASVSLPKLFRFEYWTMYSFTEAPLAILLGGSHTTVAVWYLTEIILGVEGASGDVTKSIFTEELGDLTAPSVAMAFTIAVYLVAVCKFVNFTHVCRFELRFLISELPVYI